MLADEPRWTRLIIAIQRGVAPETLHDDDLAVREVGATSSWYCHRCHVAFVAGSAQAVAPEQFGRLLTV